MSRALWFFAGFAASAVKTPPPDSMILLRRIEKLADESSKRNGKRQIPKKRRSGRSSRRFHRFTQINSQLPPLTVHNPLYS
jgi:hypothetical protein